LDKKLPNFQCPLFMLHGTEDDQVPVANVAYTQERFAALGKKTLSSSKIIPGYNHFMMWEHPDVVNAVIAEFAKQVTAQNASSR
jgi:pimeloyl-ACP methyl ester carboxylesterase